jgi:hypothetical protein
MRQWDRETGSPDIDYGARDVSSREEDLAQESPRGRPDSEERNTFHLRKLGVKAQANTRGLVGR